MSAIGIPSGTSTTPVEILLVEDNPGDIELTREGLNEGRLVNRLHVVMNGENAISFLLREGEYRDAPRPDLVLLDLNLPRISGREVLKFIRDEPSLTDVPVVILTTSESDEDIIAAYQLHVNAYMAKPVDFNKFVEMIKTLGIYWFTLVKLPGQCGT